MSTLLDILNHGDLCSLCVLGAIFLLIGSHLPDSNIRRVGQGLAVSVFLAYEVYALDIFRPRRSEDLLSIAVRGLLAAGLTLGLSWTTLPFFTWLLRTAIVFPLFRIRTVTARVWRLSQERAERRRTELERRRAQEKYDRSAPRRERQRLEMEEQARIEAEAQHSRQEARAQCEILYSIHAPEIGQRFTRDMFQDFVTRHMGEEHPAEHVEERARQLKDILQRHLEKIDPPKKKMTLADLAQWFLGEKAQIDAAAISEEDKAALISQLEERYTKLQEKCIRGMQP